MSLTSAKKVDTNKYELEISIEAKDFQEAVLKEFRKQSKNIQVPGFRKGKAPRPIIEKVYGREVFWDDAVNSLFPKVYESAVEEAGINPVDKPSAEVKEIGEDGAKLLVSVVVTPEISLGVYKGIKAEKIVRAAAGSDVDEEIARVQERNARLVPIDDRPAEAGDTLNIDYQEYDGSDGKLEETEQGGERGRELVLDGADDNYKKIKEKLTGHGVGDEFEFAGTKDRDEDFEKAKFVTRVKINSISRKELPELDDDFAKDVSEFDTFEEYKESVRKEIQERYDRESRNRFEQELDRLLAEQVGGEIPEVMYETEVDGIVERFAENVKQRFKIDFETYMSYLGLEKEKLRQDYRPQAEINVKTRLALDKIAEIEQIEASEDEIEEEYKNAAEGYNVKVEAVKNAIPVKDIEKGIKRNKAIKIIVDSAEPVEISYDDYMERLARAETVNSDEEL
ncbi:MAG: trigger factor [Oscillospiraceae bacterium]|jgi:trigger factor|nr:trigger factor [Oscillospiraceae bacterium]